MVLGHPREAVDQVERPLSPALPHRRGREKGRAAAEDPELDEVPLEVQALLKRPPEHVAAVAAHERAPGGRRVDELELGIAEPGRVERLIEVRIGDAIAVSGHQRAQAEVARAGHEAPGGTHGRRLELDGEQSLGEGPDQRLEAPHEAASAALTLLHQGTLVEPAGGLHGRRDAPRRPSIWSRIVNVKVWNPSTISSSPNTPT